jgi:SAM-dependent methyltransferase
MFLRKSSVERDPLAVTMSGVRLGERVLQIGAGEPRLLALLAAKPGVSGSSAIAVTGDRSRERAQKAIAESGALVDLHVSPVAMLPVADSAFDVIIVHETARVLAPLEPAARAAALGEWRRALRGGGRLLLIEPGTPSGLTALLRGRSEEAPPSGTVRALETAGFRAVRVLADRDGYRFIEGLKA